MLYYSITNVNPDRFEYGGFRQFLAVKLPRTKTTMINVLDTSTNAMKLFQDYVCKKKNLWSYKASTGRIEVLIGFTTDSVEGILPKLHQVLHMSSRLKHQQSSLVPVVPKISQSRARRILEQNRGCLACKIGFLILGQLKESPLQLYLVPNLQPKSTQSQIIDYFERRNIDKRRSLVSV